MSAQFDNILSTIPGINLAAYSHMYDDVDIDEEHETHIIHAFKHLETGEMRFIDDGGNEYNALGDGIFELTIRAEKPEEPESDDPMPNVTRISKVREIEDIETLTNEELDFIGFSLAGKINGRIVSYAMRVARNDMFAQRDESEEGPSIDQMNDLEAYFESNKAGADFIANSGLERPDPEWLRDQLRRWMGCRATLADRYAEAGRDPEISPISENLTYIARNAGKEMTLEQHDIDRLVAMTGQPAEYHVAVFKKKKDRSVGETFDQVKRAYAIIGEVEPLFETPEPAPVRGAHGQYEDEYTNVFNAAIESGQKVAEQRARSVEDAIAATASLRALKEAV